MHASIVICALAIHQLVGHMKKYIQERSRLNASIVKSALTGYQTVKDMKEHTQVNEHADINEHILTLEKSHFHVYSDRNRCLGQSSQCKQHE